MEDQNSPDTPLNNQVRGIPEDVALIRAELTSFLNQRDTRGNRIGSYKHGIYAFFDYDNEPVYVGQTEEMISSRVRRHLTNQRTDAVAMNVLDPFEVAYIEVWPLDDTIAGLPKAERQEYLDCAEYTVFQKVLRESGLGAVLNEKELPTKSEVFLPLSHKGRIIPDSLYSHRKHPDIRIARRATTIANLARVISEREVSTGLRRTLLIQAQRLERLATQRINELGITADFKRHS